MAFRIPTEKDRHIILGATGSGKTQCAVNNLSFRDYNERPWIIYNFKGDELIDAIPGTYELPLDQIPKSPGLFIVRPRPNQANEVETQMWSIWDRGGIGMYIDEGFMVDPRSGAFNSVLTQGRSKRIPMIVLSQRPSWMSRFTFSEASFIQVFRLQDTDDIKKVERFVPANLKNRLPDYHSYYYDVGANKLTKLAPVPPAEEILKVFASRLRRRVTAI